jgi:hypothetical protein
MKTLRETKEIDRYLLDTLSPASKILFEAKLLIDPTLKRRVEWQQRLYSLIKRSGRRQLKSEAARLHHQLFSDPAKREFQLNMFQIFSKK